MIGGKGARRAALLALLVVLIALAPVLTGCEEVAEDLERDIEREAERIAEEAGDEMERAADGASDGPSEAPRAPEPPSAAEARALLAEIPTQPPGSMAGYSREDFPHWAAEAEAYGWDAAPLDASCDVRDAALIRDGQRVRIDEDCGFISGAWIDPYTGAELTETSDVDIDHVVPLANAYRSGASDWRPADKEAYANDPGVLLAVDDGANQEKGDKGPEAWRPPNRSYWCSYSRHWTTIKANYSLTVTLAEKAALEEMLATCGANP